MTENEVFALAEVLTIGIAAVESLPEDELTFAIPETVAAGNRLDIVGAHEVFGVATLQTADTGDVAAHAHLVVGDALCRPNSSDIALAFAKDFHLPHFVRVGNGDAFAAVAITVDFDEVANEADGVACGGAALEGDALKFLDKEHTCRVDQCVGTAESAFADGELVLVEARIGGVEVGIGVGHLGDGTS